MRGCRGTERAQPRACNRAYRAARPRQDLHADVRHELRLVHGHDRPDARADDGYFDDTIFHRVVSVFVIQGCDPTQSGSGGPGYSTVDVPPSDAKYTKGVVAMAKSQVEGPGTSGSQFFVVTGEDAGLPPDYAIVGEITDGMDTVERIDALGMPGGDGPPTKPVVVSSVTVGES